MSADQQTTCKDPTKKFIGNVTTVTMSGMLIFLLARYEVMDALGAQEEL